MRGIYKLINLVIDTREKLLYGSNTTNPILPMLHKCNTNLGDMRMQTYKMTIEEALKDKPELLEEVMKVVKYKEYALEYDRMFAEVSNELLEEHPDPSDAAMVEEISERVTIERLKEAGYNLPRSI